MKPLFIALIILELTLNCSLRSTTDANCDKFKNGKFYLQAELDHTNYVIDRHDSIQVERNLSNGNINKWKVVWTEPCTYELWYLPEKPLDSKDSFFMSHAFVNKILSSTDDYYIFESSMEANGYKAIDTIFVRK